MKKIFITEFESKYKLKELFSLVRPFLRESIERNSYSELNAEVVSSIREADLVLVSEPLSLRHDQIKYRKLAEINQICKEKNIPAYVFIKGDYGKVHPSFSNIIYYRLGGFKNQLNTNNRAFFPIVSDKLKKIFNKDSIVIREKEGKPVVGFCGHATSSISKFIYEKMKLTQINIERAIRGDFCFEPLFSSAYERHQILKNLSRSDKVKTNFIYRRKYRAGAANEAERRRTTLDYYNNIIESDYVVCLRGSGNFSVRFYETLMMGRIPVFINTDCLLPLEDKIDWKRHVVWVEWNERKQIAEKIADFHKKLTKSEFIQLQEKNREIWVNYCNVNGYLKKLFETVC